MSNKVKKETDLPDEKKQAIRPEEKQMQIISTDSCRKKHACPKTVRKGQRIETRWVFAKMKKYE